MCVCVCVCVFAVGGALDEIDIRLVLGTGVDRVEEAGAIKAALAQFDAAQAQCTLARDRHRILAVIETAYGTVEPFNELVRDLFASKLAAPSASDASSQSASSYSPRSSPHSSPFSSRCSSIASLA